MARAKTKRPASAFGISESLAPTAEEEPPSADVGTQALSEPTPAPPVEAPVEAPTPVEPEPTQVEPTPVVEPTPPVAATRPAATRKSTVIRKAPAAAPERGVAALEGRHPQGGGGATPAVGHPDAREVIADYATPAWHPRVKDPTAATSTDLIDEMVAVQAEWTAANRARLSGRSQPPPTNSGFREALLRLGLKHLNDPEFIELIPPDARRKQRR